MSSMLEVSPRQHVPAKPSLRGTSATAGMHQLRAHLAVSRTVPSFSKRSNEYETSTPFNTCVSGSDFNSHSPRVASSTLTAPLNSADGLAGGIAPLLLSAPAARLAAAAGEDGIVRVPVRRCLLCLLLLPLRGGATSARAAALALLSSSSLRWLRAVAAWAGAAPSPAELRRARFGIVNVCRADTTRCCGERVSFLWLIKVLKSVETIPLPGSSDCDVELPVAGSSHSLPRCGPVR